jgi:hypothetical protein
MLIWPHLSRCANLDGGRVSREPCCYWYTETGPAPTTANANPNTTVSLPMICCASFAFFLRGMMRWSKCCNVLWTETDSECGKRAMYRILRQCRRTKQDTLNRISIAFLSPLCALIVRSLSLSHQRIATFRPAHHSAQKQRERCKTYHMKANCGARICVRGGWGGTGFGVQITLPNFPSLPCCRPCCYGV